VAQGHATRAHISEATHERLDRESTSKRLLRHAGLGGWLPFACLRATGSAVLDWSHLFGWAERHLREGHHRCALHDIVRLRELLRPTLARCIGPSRGE
jgi:hypothetical protein